MGIINYLADFLVFNFMRICKYITIQMPNKELHFVYLILFNFIGNDCGFALSIFS